MISAEQILNVLSESGPMKACQIAKALKADKSEINSVLYHQLERKGLAKQKDYIWRVTRKFREVHEEKEEKVDGSGEGKKAEDIYSAFKEAETKWAARIDEAFAKINELRKELAEHKEATALLKERLEKMEKKQAKPAPAKLPKPLPKRKETESEDLVF
jgi:predicted  nucleic acid-binding Zn-ribbon protein